MVINRSTWWILVIFTCAFAFAAGLAFTASQLSNINPGDVGASQRVGIVTKVFAPASSLAAALKRLFLREEEWSQVLSGSSAGEMLRTLEEQPPDFWESSPIAESVAYRVFGAVARSEGATAFDHAIKVFHRSELDRSKREAALRWALLGIFENQQALQIEQYLARSPQELWPHVIGAAILGSDAGSIDADMLSYSSLLPRLFQPSQQNESRQKIEGLMRRVVEAWVQRDPISVLKWLQKEGGKRYGDMAPAAIAAGAAGGPEHIAKLAADPALALKSADIAKAAYQANWDADAISSFLAEFAPLKKEEFLVGYAKEMSRGSPRTLLQFVGAADTGLLVPSVAQILAPRILLHAPHLFEKLASSMAQDDRNRLLDKSYSETFPRTLEASEVYLGLRGITTAPKAAEALARIAYDDQSKALALVASAPAEQRSALIHDIYRAGADRLINKGETTQEILNYMRSVPANDLQKVSESVIQDLTLENPRRALQLLESYDAAEPKMWALFFRYANLTPDELNGLLGEKFSNGIDPSIYSAAASRITDQFAKENIDSARDAVDALPDPKLKEDCTVALVKTWSSTDPLNTFSYVSQLPQGSRRDRAIGALLPKLSFASQKRADLLSMASSEAVRAALVAEMNKPQKGTP